MDPRDIARVCHEANRAYCEALGDLSQPSQPPWDEAPDWQVDSAIKGVQVRLENLDAPISAQHESWCADKMAEGWKWGEVKDPAKKEHPCLVPYDELPPELQVKDRLFVGIVRALAG